MVGWVFIGAGGGVVLPDVWRRPVAGCMACGGVSFRLPVCFRGPGGFFRVGCCLRHTAGDGLRFWCGNAGMLWVCALAVMCRCGAGFG